MIQQPRRVLAIAAMDGGRVIGNKNQLPWSLPDDMRHFKELTAGHAVLMGRVTYESLPPRFRPLPGRMNIIISRDAEKFGIVEGVTVMRSPGECIAAFRSGELKTPGDMLWVIGGARIYLETFPDWDELYLTLVDGEHEGDTYFPPFEESFRLESSKPAQGCTFQHFLRR